MDRLLAATDRALMWSVSARRADFPVAARSRSERTTPCHSCGFDMLRDVGHAFARKLAAAGNDLTYAHDPALPHGIIQMTMHAKACLDATEEVARLLGRRLPPR